MTKHLVDRNGRKCPVSNEKYVLTADVIEGYPKGTQVVLIGGNEGVMKLGYHFYPDYVTVSKPHAKPAHFVGVKRTDLKRVG